MTNSTQLAQHGNGGSFDLFRLTKSKEVVDLCPNTVRSLHKRGLPFYKSGRAIFVSRTELEAFIRNGKVVVAQ
jgi:hypothetical protein